MRKTGTEQFTPLTPEQRRELVERPLPVVRVVGSSRSWGGTCVIDWHTTNMRQRAYTPNTEAGYRQWLKIPDAHDN